MHALMNLKSEKNQYSMIVDDIPAEDEGYLLPNETKANIYQQHYFMHIIFS